MQPEPPLTLDIDEAAARVPCNPDWYRKQLRDRRFPGRKVGREWRVTPADIETALDIMATETITPPRDPAGLTRGARRHLEKTTR